jgi:hypothetical protein
MFSMIVVGQPSTQKSNYLFQNKFLNIYNQKIHDYDVSPDIQWEKIKLEPIVKVIVKYP